MSQSFTTFFRQLVGQVRHDHRSLRSHLKFSYYEAFLSSLIIGVAENFFAAFALEKGMSILQSGLLLSLPLLFAAGFNLFFHARKKNNHLSQTVMKNVALQGFSLAGLMFFAMTPSFIPGGAFFVLLALFSLYWYGFYSSQPAWNSWISEILDEKQGQTYFALRTRLNQVGIICGLLIGGGLLHLNVMHVSIELAFTALFMTGVLCHILKLHSFRKHHVTHSVINFSFPKFKYIFKKNRSFFSTYALFNFSLFMSSPYVTGYLLNERKIDYLSFMTITISLFVGKIFTTIVLSLKERDVNPVKMMSLGGLLAAPLPLLWPYCDGLQSMVALHAFSGVAWALWEIGLSLSFFKKISRQDKIETISLYQTIGIITQVAGTCVSALLIKHVFDHDYRTVFIFAGIARLICVLPFQKNTDLVGENERACDESLVKVS